MNVGNFDATDTVLVIGMGKSGLASVAVLRTRGVTVYATDEKPPAEIAEAISSVERAGGRFIAGADLDALLAKLTLAVLSPGVPLTSRVVRQVQAHNVPVFGEIEVAYRLCKAPIVAVTGTKGKSTTTALIGHLLRACGKTVFVGGNIGNPLIREIGDAGSGDWVVAEVSSFQLETIRSFKPRAAVLLNIAPDHLDRYHSMEEYAEAKYRIFANQSADDYFVGNLDDGRIAALQSGGSEHRMRSKQLWFTQRDRHGAATMYVHDGSLTYAPPWGDPRPRTLLRSADIPLPGGHNVLNVMAAMLAALAVGCDPIDVCRALASFRPMPHRLESVGEIDGVLYVDDSKATNPGSVVAALRSFNRPVVLIAGGRSKGTDFTELGVAIRQRAKALVVIGEAATEIARVSNGVAAWQEASMADAVLRARHLAAPGDVVVLSPGCASFDMFASAEDRGERFAAAVDALRERAGA
ncbi:MAG: UDP-N-acetylmuramoyl-L-alanine--D-glutamate ligase [Candidatus Eremiobacteraeota bacterium]|nr:UDP-N-acetylmuramoyl-L-alanine--D-glutamate ligase [Candidatus Eremiobacteraeota bacterium]